MTKAIVAFVTGSHVSLDFIQQVTGDTDNKDSVHTVHCLSAKKILKDRQDAAGHIGTSLYG